MAKKQTYSELEQKIKELEKEAEKRRRISPGNAEKISVFF